MLTLPSIHVKNAPLVSVTASKKSASSVTEMAAPTTRELVLATEELAALDALDRDERLVSPDFGPQWD